MKKIISQVFLFTSVILMLGSCGSYVTLTGNLKVDSSKLNETTKSEELHQYLDSKENIKFVLREPSGYKNMPEPEKVKYDEIFAEVEKELIQNGHTVKDRVLLNVLIQNGLSDTEIGKALDTDIIIDIIDVEFNIPNKVTNFKLKETGQNSDFKNWNTLDYVDCQLSKLECRITMANVGNVGGIFKFYVSGCDNSNDFYLKAFETTSGVLDTEKESFVGWNYGNVNYRSLTHTYNMNEQSRNTALKRLVKALLSELESKE